MADKIGFKDLTPALRTLVILCWIMIGFYGITFIIGIIVGIVESI